MPTDDTNSNRDNDILTPVEAARVLRISRSSIYAMIGSGQIPHIRLSPRCIRLSRESLMCWMRENEKGGALATKTKGVG